MHRISTRDTPAAPVDPPWSALIPDEQWEILRSGTGCLREVGIPSLLGGAMALAAYTQRWRNTKDIDLIITPGDAPRAIDAVRAIGFDDYFDQEPYDRSWIFRACRAGVLLDLIWDLPNHRVAVDAAWFDRARPVQLRGHAYAAVPAEELIRVKLYVMQRDRCDWVDVLNVISGACDQLDWAWLVRRMGADLPLLHAALALFNWLCPGRARSIPDSLRQQFALPAIGQEAADAVERRHVNLFDSRPWFALHQPVDRPLER